MATIRQRDEDYANESRARAQEIMQNYLKNGVYKTPDTMTRTGERVTAADLKRGVTSTVEEPVSTTAPMNSHAKLYRAENGLNYSSNHPLGAEAIIKGYTETMQNAPTRKESERTAQAYERLRGYDDTEPTYSQSDTVTAALDRLRSAEAARPGAYNNRYQADIDAILGQLRDREAFSYDPTQDALYQTTRDQALRAGQRAMVDSIGNAAGMSGGYGSSYATAAGQQAYQDYLAGLNNSLGAMYDAAYQRYRDETGDLYDRLGALEGLENQDYSRYRDQLNDYLTERNYANTQYQDERNTDYDRFRDTMGDWQTDRNYWYNLYNSGRASDLAEYQTDLEQWQRDKAYWDELLQTLAVQYDIPLSALQETVAPIINVMPQDSDATYAAWLAGQNAAKGSGKSSSKSSGTGSTIADKVRSGAITAGGAQIGTQGAIQPASMIGTGWSEKQVQDYARNVLGDPNPVNAGGINFRGPGWSDAAYQAALAKANTPQQAAAAATIQDILGLRDKYGTR